MYVQYLDVFGFNLPVVMRRPNMHEGRVVSEREHAKSQAVQDVYHARNSGELSKGDHPLALNVAHPLKHEEYNQGWSGRKEDNHEMNDRT